MVLSFFPSTVTRKGTRSAHYITVGFAAAMTVAIDGKNESPEKLLAWLK